MTKNSGTLWVVGAGPMAQAYAAVIDELGLPFDVVGRGLRSAKSFAKVTGKKVIHGGVAQALASGKAPNYAIVSTGIGSIVEVSIQLIKSGTKHLLIEKPGSVYREDLVSLKYEADVAGAKVFVAYNRRFYSSVQKAEEIINEDGGLRSIHYEFTEWSHVIRPLIKEEGVKERWLISNSSHVIDLALFLGGVPADWRAWSLGSSDWHPSSDRFAGAGVTGSGVLFSYKADWGAPGRWSVEMFTCKRRIIMMPLEQLQVVLLGSTEKDNIKLDDELDRMFKPGLYRQVESFLMGDKKRLCALDEQIENMNTYIQMAGY